MKVKVNIDSIVLTGFNDNDASGFAQELEQELSRLVRENGISGISSIDALGPGTVHLAHSAKSELDGKHVARSIYRSLSKDG